jgi:uncharacterized membrane protein
MDTRTAVRAACAFFALGAAPAFGQAHYTVTDLGLLGGLRTEGLAMNAHGQVAGQATLANGRQTAFFWDGTALRNVGAGLADDAGVALNDAGQVALDSGYRWTAGTREPIVAPAGVQAKPAAIDASGVVVGTLVYPNGLRRAMRWTGGAAQDLGTLGGAVSEAFDVNDAGQIAGSAEPLGGGPQRAAIWTNGAPRDFGVPPGGYWARFSKLNASGQAIGHGAGAGAAVPIRWTGARVEVLESAGGIVSLVAALNDRGQAVGDTSTGLGPVATLWDVGTTRPTLLISPTLASTARDINTAGSVVGWVHWGTPGTMELKAFLWNGRVRVLEDALDPADPLYGRVRLVYGLALNDSDQVMAVGFLRSSPAAMRTFVLTPRIPRFDFRGFLPPLKAPPATAVAKAGSAVPVRFSLGGYRGPDVFAAGYPRVGSCEPSDASAPASSAGRSGLAYDAGADAYTFVWKTEKTWAGACRRLEIAFVDETPVRSVTFTFR